VGQAIPAPHQTKDQQKDRGRYREADEQKIKWFEADRETVTGRCESRAPTRAASKP
jgi:hypothetical protein